MTERHVPEKRVAELHRMYLAGTLHSYVRDVVLGGLHEEEDLDEVRNIPELDGRDRTQRW